MPITKIWRGPKNTTYIDFEWNDADVVITENVVVERDRAFYRCVTVYLTPALFTELTNAGLAIADYVSPKSVKSERVEFNFKGCRRDSQKQARKDEARGKLERLTEGFAEAKRAEVGAEFKHAVMDRIERHNTQYLEWCKVVPICIEQSHLSGAAPLLALVEEQKRLELEASKVAQALRLAKNTAVLELLNSGCPLEGVELNEPALEMLRSMLSRSDYFPGAAPAQRDVAVAQPGDILMSTPAVASGYLLTFGGTWR